MIYFLDSQVAAFQVKLLLGCLPSIFAQKGVKWGAQLSRKFVGAVVINARAFLIRRRRWAFLWNCILQLSLSQKEMYNVTSDRVGNDKNHNLHVERAFNDFKAFSHLVSHLLFIPSL